MPQNLYYSADLDGDYFFALKLVTDDNGKIVSTDLSDNIDQAMHEKMQTILSKVDLKSLEPFLEKKSEAVIPIFVLINSPQDLTRTKKENFDLWNFSNGYNVKTKYQLLPPIIFKTTKRQMVPDKIAKPR